jgi:hypothetical protein
MDFGPHFLDEVVRVDTWHMPSAAKSTGVRFDTREEELIFGAKGDSGHA